MAILSWWAVPGFVKCGWRGTPAPSRQHCTWPSENAMLLILLTQKTRRIMGNTGTALLWITLLSSTLHGSIRVSPNWEDTLSGASWASTEVEDMLCTWGSIPTMPLGNLSELGLHGNLITQIAKRDVQPMWSGLALGRGSEEHQKHQAKGTSCFSR